VGVHICTERQYFGTLALDQHNTITIGVLSETFNQCNKSDHSDADLDPNFHLNADPDTDPDSTQSFTHVERSEEFF
jgi:hypothetical protein